MQGHFCDFRSGIPVHEGELSLCKIPFDDAAVRILSFPPIDGCIPESSGDRVVPAWADGDIKQGRHGQAPGWCYIDQNPIDVDILDADYTGEGFRFLWKKSRHRKRSILGSSC